RLHELFGGAVDYVELVNTGCCRLDTGGLMVLYRGSCDTTTHALAVPAGTLLSPARRLRLGDTATTIGNELVLPEDVCHEPGGAGWAALCDGPCNVIDCHNLIDYVAVRRGAALPARAPACASMRPGPPGVRGRRARRAPCRCRRCCRPRRTTRRAGARDRAARSRGRAAPASGESATRHKRRRRRCPAGSGRC